MRKSNGKGSHCHGSLGIARLLSEHRCRLKADEAGHDHDQHCGQRPGTDEQVARIERGEAHPRWARVGDERHVVDEHDKQLGGEQGQQHLAVEVNARHAEKHGDRPRRPER